MECSLCSFQKKNSYIAELLVLLKKGKWRGLMELQADCVFPSRSSFHHAIAMSVFSRKRTDVLCSKLRYTDTDTVTRVCDIHLRSTLCIAAAFLVLR